jgi:hypothetical protein
MGVYADLAGRCAKIDKRTLRYRFDLERDVAWSRLAEPGLYFTPQLLEDLGIDATRLAAHPEAHDLFQWALALSTCRTFDDLEGNIVRVIDASRSDLKDCRSAELLYDEEVKHIELFKRYGAHLETLHPELMPRFNELYVRCQYIHTIGIAVELPEDARFLREQHPHRYVTPDATPKTAEELYPFWLGVLFFEEFTVYLHDRFEDSAGVQPAWRSAHAAHRKEEIQHIVTDAVLLKALDLDRGVRRRSSMLFAYALMQTFRYFMGLDTPCVLVRELFPELPDFEHTEPFGKSRFCAAMRSLPAFAHTRAEPGFSFLRQPPT